MNFRDMLIMIGPTGVSCEHSIMDIKSGKAKNNHWCISGSGVVIARGSDYTAQEYQITELASYKNKSAKLPPLLTVSSKNIVKAEVTEEMINDSWTVMSNNEISALF